MSDRVHRSEVARSVPRDRSENHVVPHAREEPT